MNLMKPPDQSNCEPDGDLNLMYKTNINLEDGNDSCSSSCSSNLSLSSLSSIEVFSEENDPPNVTLEDCSNAYFAGYLGKKCVDKFKCSICEGNMLKDIEDATFNNQEFLIFCKNYSSENSLLHLKRPTVDFTEFVSLAQKIIKKTVEKMPHKKNISKFIFSKIKNDLSSVINFNSSCEPHIDFLVTHLINCKLLRDFNWKSKNIKSNAKDKNKNKLSILKNN